MSQFEGNLIKGKGNAVYWIYNKQKHHILNPSTFNRLFESWDCIKKVDDKTIQDFSTGFAVDDQARIKQGESALDVYLKVASQRIKLTKELIEKANFKIETLDSKKQLEELMSKGKDMLKDLGTEVLNEGKDKGGSALDKMKDSFKGMDTEELKKKMKDFMKK